MTAHCKLMSLVLAGSSPDCVRHYNEGSRFPAEDDFFLLPRREERIQLPLKTPESSETGEKARWGGGEPGAEGGGLSC